MTYFYYSGKTSIMITPQFMFSCALKDELIIFCDTSILADAGRGHEGIPSRRARNAEDVRVPKFQRTSGRVSEAPSDRGSSALKNRPWSKK